MQFDMHFFFVRATRENKHCAVQKPEKILCNSMRSVKYNLHIFLDWNNIVSAKQLIVSNVTHNFARLKNLFLVV